MEQSCNNARPQTLFFTASPTQHCSLDFKTFILCPVPFDQGLAKNAHSAFCILHLKLRLPPLRKPTAILRRNAQPRRFEPVGHRRPGHAAVQTRRSHPQAVLRILRPVLSLLRREGAVTPPSGPCGWCVQRLRKLETANGKLFSRSQCSHLRRDEGIAAL